MPGCDDLGQEVGGDAEAVEERPGPVLGPRVERLAGGGLGVLAHAHTAQEVVEDVRHHQQLVSLLEDGVVRADLAEQLVERVDGHELDARGHVQLIARDGLEGHLEHGFVARVAIVDGVADEPAAGVDVGVVHAPGVDRDRVHRAISGGALHAREDVAELPGEVPVQRAAHPHRRVGIAMHRLDAQLVAVEAAHDGTATLGTEVQRHVSKPTLSHAASP